MSETLKALKDRYVKATTQRELAELECECWAKFGSKRTKDMRHDFVAKVFDANRFHVRTRLGLLGYGEKAEKLWGPLETGMTLNGALTIYLAAKYRRRPDESYECSLDRELARWASSGVYPNMPQVRAEAAGLGKQSSEGKEREFRKIVTEACCTHVSEKLTGFDEFEKNVEIEWFERELKVLFEQLYARVRDRARRHGDAQPSRRRFLGACHTLRIDPPKKVSVDWKKVAQRQMKRMAREYHPDQTNGATEAQFNSVMEAWRVIDQYENGVINGQK